MIRTGTDAHLQGSHGAWSPTHRARVLIAGRRPMAARGLAATFDEGVEFAVQARCHDVRELPSALGVGCTIDAVVIDVDLCEGDALCAFEAIRRLADGVAVLLLAPRVDQSLLRAIAQPRGATG